MSKNTCRMIGLVMMLIAVFFLIGGLYLGDAGLPAFAAPACLIAGIVLMAAGIVFYRVLKSD